jgi:histidine triad (HIT) family protein
MDDCIFCKITAGKIPAYKIYEDDATLAFLDISPIREGHTLVIPKIHNPDLHHLDDATFDAVMHTSKKVATILEQKLQPKRVGMLVAGWDVPHAHVHVVPMQEYHDLTSKMLLDETRKHPTEEELIQTKEKLAAGT